MPANKNYDICFHVGDGDFVAYFYLDLKDNLEKQGIKVLLFTLHKKVFEIIKSRNIEDYIYLEQKENNLTIVEIENFLESINFQNLRSIYRSEKLFYSLSDNECIERVSNLISSLISKDKISAKYFLTYEGDEIEHNIFRIFTKMNKGKTTYFGYSSYKLRLYFHDNDHRYWKVPKSIPTYSNNLLEDFRIKAKNHIDEYKNKQTTLWGNPSESDIKFKLSYFFIALKKIIQQFRGKIDNSNFTFYKSFKAYFLRLYRRQVANLFYTEITKLDNEYYYFPLHVPNDSQLTQRGLPFINQVSLIEIISQYIPYSQRLYVKEHPHGRGLYKITDLKKIAKINNVILINPNINSHDILPKAKAIFVINSSVGFESLFYKKPVITFGRSFFRDEDLTIDINSLYEIEDVFNKIQQRQFNENILLNFLWRINENSFDLDLYTFNIQNYKQKSILFSQIILKYFFNV